MSSFARTAVVLARAAAVGLATYFALLSVGLVLVLGFFVSASRAYTKVLGWTFGGLDGAAWISIVVAATTFVVGVRAERMRSTDPASTAPDSLKGG